MRSKKRRCQRKFKRPAACICIYIYIDICTYLHNSYLSNSVCVSMGHIRMYMSLCSVTSTKQAFIAQGD